MKTKFHLIITAAILLSLPLKGISQDVIIESGNASAQNTSTFNNHFSLQTFPNPVRDHATVSYVVPENGKVIISVYNQTGQIVKVLADETLLRGIYSLDWNGTDDGGNRISRGIYVVRLQTASGIQAETISVE
jgi:flagellar hook assembly protein FlgD